MAIPAKIGAAFENTISETPRFHSLRRLRIPVHPRTAGSAELISAYSASRGSLQANTSLIRDIARFRFSMLVANEIRT